ncbi:MAG: EamA family transporter [Acidimicrobiales bacterium]
MSRIGVRRCLGAAVLFGASAPTASVLASDMSAFLLAGLLYVGAGLAVAPAVRRHPPTRAALRDGWRPLAVAVIAGGALGPALLVLGLARVEASTASILLNVELVATVVVAGLFFGEHLGRRVLLAAGLITAGGVLLVWSPGGSVSAGALFVVAACACWGLDNSVTARIEHLSPESVVLAKGAVAGSVNVVLGWTVASGAGASLTVGQLAAALVVGGAGYGLSITWWVKGARDLGAARAQVIFATAPFIGAVGAWVGLGDAVSGVQVAAVALAAVGVWLSIDSAHGHRHRHEPAVHDHGHTHPDEHHDPEHEDEHEPAFAGRHSHRHFHQDVVVHDHPHVPDLHHHHRHD